MPSPRGFCNSCLQEDRPLLSKTSDECHSCYKRRRDAEKAKALADTLPPVALPPNWGKVPCELCGALVEFGEECRCAVVDEPEMDDLVDSAPKPQKSGLCRLLDTDGWLVEIPRGIARDLDEAGVTPDDINELLQALVNGELRRVI